MSALSLRRPWTGASVSRTALGCALAISGILIPGCGGSGSAASPPSGAAGASGAGGAGAGGSSGGAGNGGGTPGPKPEDVPPSVVMTPTDMLSWGYNAMFPSPVPPRHVDGFRITTTPITVKQYRGCVDAGACTRPAENDDGGGCIMPVKAGLPDTDTYDYGEAFATVAAADLALTCATGSQAEAYCEWLGAKLPTTAQWRYAAWGTVPKKFPWGNEPVTCDRLPNGDQKLPHTVACCLLGQCSNPVAAFSVGAHPMGASASGITDVGLYQWELTRGDPTDPPNAGCPDSPYCLNDGPPVDVTISAGGTNGNGGAISTFRCAWKN